MAWFIFQVGNKAFSGGLGWLCAPTFSLIVLTNLTNTPFLFQLYLLQKFSLTSFLFSGLVRDAGLFHLVLFYIRLSRASLRTLYHLFVCEIDALVSSPRSTCFYTDAVQLSVGRTYISTFASSYPLDCFETSGTEGSVGNVHAMRKTKRVMNREMGISMKDSGSH